MRSLCSIGLGFVAAMAAQAGAQAAPQCGQRGEVLTSLEKRYTEQPVAVGLDNNGALVEVIAAPEGQTWTILISMPNGVSCVVAAGEHWALRPVAAVARPGT